MDGLWATKSEDVGLIARAISFQDVQLCGPDPPTSRTDGQTDGTTCNPNSALFTKVHRAVKKLPHSSRHRIPTKLIQRPLITPVAKLGAIYQRYCSGQITMHRRLTISLIFGNLKTEIFSSLSFNAPFLSHIRSHPVSSLKGTILASIIS